jgi:hypothetical protein
VTPETPLEPLVQSLLFEGYALYPYTPGATKNATPTPFGIVYPPAYAEGNPHTHAMLRMECLLEAGDDAELTGDVRFLQGSGADHQAIPRRLELGPVALGDAARLPFGFDPLAGRIALRSEREPDGRWRVRLCVHNETTIEPGAERKAALGRALISTHVVVAVIGGGRFVSPLEGGVASVNTFPVLATEADDAVLGAAIVLPDHPQLAPESLGTLFDNTEIEEALLLHVHTLSDDERASMSGDPAVSAMLERAMAATPQEIIDLHGRTTVGPSAGEPEVCHDGVTFRPQMKVVLHPGVDGDPYDRMLDGRTATIQRIYIDYDDRVHLGLTVDDDPVQEIMRDTGRYLYFFPHEVEVADA